MTTSVLEAISSIDARAHEATSRGAEAFARLLKLAETGDSGQIRRVADFVGATYNGRRYRFDPFELRAVDVSISDDMLSCLDALRWACADLYHLVPNGEPRVRAVIRQWGLGERGDG